LERKIISIDSKKKTKKSKGKKGRKKCIHKNERMIGGEGGKKIVYPL
jgi:hypothetical protein